MTRYKYGISTPVPETSGAILSTKIPTGPTGKSCPTSNGGPVFSKLFRLDRTVLLSVRPKFPEILVEWIAPIISSRNQWWRGEMTAAVSSG